MMDREMAGMLVDSRREREKVVAETKRLEAEIITGTVSSGALDDYIEELRALRMKIHHFDARIIEVSSLEGEFTLSTNQIPDTKLTHKR
jgi:hypothetical protein